MDPTINFATLDVYYGVDAQQIIHVLHMSSNTHAQCGARTVQTYPLARASAIPAARRCRMCRFNDRPNDD